MIKYNQLNHISAEWLIVGNLLGGWGIFEIDSVDSGCMWDSVESYHKEKSDVNVLNNKIE